MGDVFLARQVATGEKVAIKLLRSDENDSENSLRFVRETRIVEQISHPHIVRVFDSGSVDGNRYFVMEFIAGGCLRDLMPAGCQLDPTQALSYLKQIGSALSYLHKRSIIHRDLKPENILIDESGCSKVTDFGLSVSKADLGTMTVTGQFLGTMDYIAPEQRYRLPLDERVDLFALGVIAYELLVGKRPLGSFKAPSEFNPQLSRQTDMAILRALEEDPDDRFSSVDEFLVALESAICSTADGSFARYAVAAMVVFAIGMGILYSAPGPPPAADSVRAASAQSTHILNPVKSPSAHADKTGTQSDNASGAQVGPADVQHQETPQLRKPSQAAAGASADTVGHQDTDDPSARDTDPPPGAGVKELVALSAVAMRQEQYTTAVNYLTQALNTMPGDVGILQTRSYCYWKQMKIEPAMQDLRTVLDTHPDAHESRARYGMMLFQQRRYTDALKLLDEGVRRNSEFALFYAYRGWVHYRLHDMDSAIDDLNRAIEIDDECGEAFQYRALVHQRNRRYRDTLSDLERSVNCMPENPFAHAFLASFLSTCKEKSLRDGKRALEIARRACSLSGWGEFQSLRSLAAAHAELGEFDDAIRWCGESMKCAPTAYRKKLEQQVQYYRRCQTERKSDTVAP